MVVGTPAVLRILAITGVDHLIDVYPSVAAAMAATDQPVPGGKTPPGYATTHADDFVAPSKERLSYGQKR